MDKLTALTLIFCLGVQLMIMFVQRSALNEFDQKIALAQRILQEIKKASLKG